MAFKEILSLPPQPPSKSSMSTIELWFHGNPIKTYSHSTGTTEQAATEHYNVFIIKFMFVDAAGRPYLISSMRRSSRFAFVLLRSSISAVIFRHWLCPSASVALILCFNSSQSFCATKCACSALKKGSGGKLSRSLFCLAPKEVEAGKESWGVNPPGCCISQLLNLTFKLTKSGFRLRDMSIFLSGKLHVLLNQSLH